jgi:hypothetical protein
MTAFLIINYHIYTSNKSAVFVMINNLNYPENVLSHMTSNINKKRHIKWPAQKLHTEEHNYRIIFGILNSRM